MAEATRARANPLHRGLPDEIVIWEILVRLAPKSLLRCCTVCRAWRRDTSTHDFLLAHHGRQPSLPIVGGYVAASRTQNILAFDHRSAEAQLQPVARLGVYKILKISCDGLLVILSIHSLTRLSFSVCNPVTRQHAPLRLPWDFSLFHLLGMYLHRSSGEYRLLIYRTSDSVSMSGQLLPGGENAGCYVVTVGSDLPPRYIGGPEAASALRFNRPALLRDSLHWSPVQHRSESESRLIIVFDTIAESFRQMRAPAAPMDPSIFDMDGTLGIYSYNDTMEVVDIWVLPNYKGEVWEHKYHVGLPLAEIKGQSGRREGRVSVTVASANGDILLLLDHGDWLFYVDINGKLVDSFYRDGQRLYAKGLCLKQTLVPHNFFTTLEDYDVNASPFI